MSKILLLEDDLSLINGLSFAFKKQGFELNIARTLKEADALWADGRYDLLVLDVSLPDGTGFEFCKRVRQVSKVPIIFLTASDEETSIIMGLDMGGDDYITKPFKLSDLRLRINNIIENRQRIQRDFKQQTLEETHHKAAAMTEPDNELLQQALQCVHTHLDDADYDRDAFAADMNMSASTLYNKLRSLTGMSVSSFIRDIRMKEARRIITENPGIRVSDLAYRVGFKDPKYFATIFKKEFGIQPKEFITDAANKQ